MGSDELALFARRLEAAKPDLDRLVPGRSYVDVYHLIVGTDCGLRDSGVSRAFQSWIVEQDRPSRPELVWPFLVIGWLHSPNRRLRDMSDEENRWAVGLLFERFDQFFQDPSASDYLPGEKGRFADISTIGAFLPWLQRWHGIFVINRTFTGTCAFLNGFELGSSREWTGAFTEYLRCETAAPEAGAWPDLVLSATLGPDVTLAQAPGFTPEQDTAVCDGLFTLLNRFLDEGWT